MVSRMDEDISELIRNYTGERELLAHEVVRAARAGTPAFEVASRMRAAFPQQLVAAKVEAEQFALRVRAILNDAGILADVAATYGL